ADGVAGLGIAQVFQLAGQNLPQPIGAGHQGLVHPQQGVSSCHRFTLAYVSPSVGCHWDSFPKQMLYLAEPIPEKFVTSKVQSRARPNRAVRNLSVRRVALA